MIDKNSLEKPREVDRLTANIDSWWKKDFVFVKKNRARSWKIIFVLAFVLGMVGTFWWIIHLRIQTRSRAEVKIKSPMMEKIKNRGCVADGLLTGSGGDTDNLIEMINRSECAYLHRAIETWVTPPDFDQISKNLGKLEKPDMIVGMFLAEAINPKIIQKYKNEKGEEIKFDFSKMCQKGSEGFWGDNTCKASMDSKEYRKYLQYITQKAIDLGVQSFLFGQIYFQDKSGSVFSKAPEIVAEMRQYARKQGKEITIGAQTDTIIDPEYLALFDYIEGGVGVNAKGEIENGPCFSRWWKKPGDRCWALLWHSDFSARANDVILNFDWSGFSWDDMSTFAKMDRATRAKTARNLHAFFASKNMGFLIPYLAVINEDIPGCEGPQKNYYAPGNLYSCKDEDEFNAILRSAKKSEALAAAGPMIPEKPSINEPAAVLPAGGEAEKKATNQTEFVSQVVPKEMTSGYRYQVSIILKNTGNTVWSKDKNYELRARIPEGEGKILWNGVVEMKPEEAVAPGQEKTFTFDFFAPDVPGEYNFSWGMYQKEIGEFGISSENVKVAVKAEK